MSHPNLDGLLRLSRTQGVDIRPALLRVLTDLYVQESSHTREEQRQYVELALQLVPAVDLPTRSAVARKLAAYPHAPVAVMSRLLQDAPELAAAVADALPLSRGREQIAGDAPGPHQAGKAFVPARLRPTLPSPSAARSTPRQQVAMRTLGETFLDSAPQERAALLGPALDEADTAREPFGPSNARVRARLEDAAMARNPQAFARELQRALGISVQTAERIVADDHGEPVLVALKALGTEPETLVRILLFLNPTIGESINSVFSLVRLYDEMSSSQSHKIVASWREDSAVRAASRFRPALSDAGSAAPGAREQSGSRRSGTEAPAERHENGIADRFRQDAS
jgi:uncharacterized protein (DUF2336 family)